MFFVRDFVRAIFGFQIAPLILGGLISGIGSLLGGTIQGAFASDAAAATNAANTQLAHDQMKLQEFYAQNGISIKANDARRAGVNVATAMGASTSSPSFSGFSHISDNGGAGAGFGAGLAEAGQNIASMITREHELEETNKLARERMRLENDLLRSQVSILKNPARQTQLPSAVDQMPMPGQGNSALVVKPAEVTASSRSNPGVEPGAINELQYSRDVKGVYRPIMSSDFKARSEDDVLSTIDWNLRNRLFSWWSGPSAPGFSAGRGRHWEWDVGAQGYIAVPDANSKSFASPTPAPYSKYKRR